ncbi:MAG: bifunctional molybdenum cofactor biosynthesis protein MoaC/MoaB [Pseudobdellovibrionaceae bacterium]
MTQNFRMIDVGEKAVTRRKSIATGTIHMAVQTIEMIKSGHSPKGNILAIAEVAGIMAAKNTSQHLPLCHPLLLDSVRIWFEIHGSSVTAFCEVICHAKTGVEMEALVGVNTCLLTIYDLAKAVDPVLEITNVYLDTKEGGKSGLWRHPKTEKAESPTPLKDLSYLRFAVATLSDRASQGLYKDESGPGLISYFNARQAQEIFYSVIPDERETLKKIINRATEEKVDVLLLTGGTGLSERDITPDVIKELASKELTGFGEKQRIYGSNFTNAAWLSRASAYVVGKTLVVLFPGSPKAVKQGLEAIGDLIPHAIKMIRNESHHNSAGALI